MGAWGASCCRHTLGTCAMSASPARRVAREVVTRVRERSAYAHELMDSALRNAALSPADTALATRLAYGTIQAEGTLLEVLDRYLGGKRVEPRISDALRVSAYEILFMRSETRAAVHQGVELVREVRKQAAGLANAVLRRLAEDAPGFPWGDPARDVNALARLHAHPVWLAEMLIEELGREAAEQVMAADNTPAPLYLAANRFVGSAESAREVLRVGRGSSPPRRASRVHRGRRRGCGRAGAGAPTRSGPCGRRLRSARCRACRGASGCEHRRGRSRTRDQDRASASSRRCGWWPR